MDTFTYIFKHSKSFYVVTDDNEDEAWKRLAYKLSKSLERTKKESTLVASHKFYGFTKLKI